MKDQDRIKLYWSILKGNISLKETIKIFDPEITEEKVEALLDEEKSSWTVFSLVGALQFSSYLSLVALGLIDGEKIFHMGSSSTDPEPSKVRHGDIGYKGKNMYRYANGKWEFCF